MRDKLTNMIAFLVLALQGPTWLTPLREKLDLPAIGGLEIENGKVVGLTVEGIREVGSTETAAKDSVWHLGSNTKAMTAVLVATYIKTGQIGFDSKVLPLLKVKPESVAKGWEDLTIRQLLEHASGLSPESYPSGRAWFLDKRPVRVQRAEYVLKALAKEPGPKSYVYSNANYTILGAVCEQLGDDTWESLITKRVFTPLGIKSAGFGPVSLRDPQPHLFREGKFRELEQDEVTDNAAVIYPAGAAHMNLEDYARWLQAVLSRDKQLLSESVWQELLTPSTEKGKYAGGWMTVREGGTTKFLTHFGSNT
ncbi:MAG: serine hydrolase, partial [Fimbriimonadaceae bacterium]